MKKKLFITLAAMAMGLVGCTQGEKAESEKTKSLVLYYSQTGATKAVAEELQGKVGADIEPIEVEVPYDGTYSETIERCQKEMETGELPVLKPLKSDLALYDTIYLGYPVWFGTFARPVVALVGQNEFEGKVVVPFCTFGSGGLQATVSQLREALPRATVLDGYGVRNARIDKMPKELDDFLKRSGLVEGEPTKLDDFSGQQPVTEEEKAIFNAACGDYQFPLGTPVTVGSRSVEDGTEYKYTVTSKDRDGNDASAIIYVVKGNGDGQKPEFTQVVRQ